MKLLGNSPRRGIADIVPNHLGYEFPFSLISPLVGSFLGLRHEHREVRRFPFKVIFPVAGKLDRIEFIVEVVLPQTNSYHRMYCVDLAKTAFARDDLDP